MAIGRSRQRPGDRTYPVSEHTTKPSPKTWGDDLPRHVGYLAAADEADLHHEAVIEVLDRLLASGEELLVHNYVLLEVSALLQRRLGLSQARAALEQSDDYRVHWITTEDHAAALGLMGRRGRRELSLTDCASFIVMRRYGLTQALAFDADFEAEGFTQYR